MAPKPMEKNPPKPTPTTTLPPQSPASTTSSLPTQPTVPRPSASTTPPPITTAPTQNDVPTSIAPGLLNPATLSAEGQQYALGVSGRRIYNPLTKTFKYEGYKFTSPTTKVTAEPKYFAGDEDSLYGLSIEALSNLQTAMYSIGRLGKGYIPGIVDSKTTSAYKSLLVTANGYGEDFETTLSRMKVTGASARGGQLNQYRVTNDADVKSIMNKVAQQTLGRKLGEGDLNRLSTMYRDLEQQAGTSTSAQVVTPPQVETFAQNKLEQMFPEDTNARQFGSYLTAIEKKYNL